MFLQLGGCCCPLLHFIVSRQAASGRYCYFSGSCRIPGICIGCIFVFAITDAIFLLLCVPYLYESGKYFATRHEIMVNIYVAKTHPFDPSPSLPMIGLEIS